MKASIQSAALLAAASLILVLTGCEEKEVHISTTVNPDGSITRLLAVSGDADDLKKTLYPILLDETFTTRLEESGLDSGSTAFYAEKRYPDARALNEDLHRCGPDSGKAVISVDLKKRFRWFYTFLSYTETWKATAQFDALPISDFLSADELALYAIDTDTLGLDDKVASWFGHSMFRHLFSELTAGADSLNDPGLSSTLLIREKEKLYECTQDTLLSFGKDLEEDVDSLLTAYADILNTDLIYELRPNAVRGVRKIGREIENLPEFTIAANELFIAAVQMPGLLIDSNARSVTGNSAQWIFNDDRLWIADVVLAAESRVVNRWAIYVSGGVFLVIAALLIISLIRRRD